MHVPEDVVQRVDPRELVQQMLAPGMAAVHNALGRRVRDQQIDSVRNLLPLCEALWPFEHEGPLSQGWDVWGAKNFVAEQLNTLMLKIVNIFNALGQKIFEQLRVTIFLQVLQLIGFALKLDQPLFESLRIKRKLVISGDDNFLAVILLLDPLGKLLRFFACAPHSEVASVNQQIAAAEVQPLMKAMRV